LLQFHQGDGNKSRRERGENYRFCFWCLEGNSPCKEQSNLRSPYPPCSLPGALVTALWAHRPLSAARKNGSGGRGEEMWRRGNSVIEESGEQEASERGRSRGSRRTINLDACWVELNIWKI
jgi:hypothetical protein